MSLPAPASVSDLSPAAAHLLTAAAVRERSNVLFDCGLAGSLAHFTVDLSRLDAAADYVVRVMRSNYPTLQVPPHSRWRHFEVGEVDRWGGLAGARDWGDALELGRAAFDLAFVGVLLGAGAGPHWGYAEALTGETYSRSEGLAVASLVMFASGVFSSEPFDPLRADARALGGLTLEELADGLQVSSSNALAGLDARLGVLHRLSAAMAARPDVYGVGGGIRPGGLLDHLLRLCPDGSVPAPLVQQVLMETLGPVFPGAFSLGSVPLGDTWAHRMVVTGDATDALVPFHTASQWLAYSLIEPIVWAGYDVRDLDGLTALAEPRNGGLLIDTGVIKLRDPTAIMQAHKLESELVVEWRALTVALIDRLANAVRHRIARSAVNFPLACVLEGGTWAAGRRIAREKRPHGPAPILIEGGDGTF